MNNFKRLLESSYKELQELGSKKAMLKPDGSKVTIHGKNYSRGYYEKKLQSAMRRNDKLEIKLYKDALARLDKVKYTSDQDFPNNKI